MGQVLVYCKGLPASGKSTWANKQAQLDKHTVIVNRDKIREMLKGQYHLFPFGSKMESLVTEIENATIYNALKQGYNVISDNTNFRVNSNTIKEMKLSFPHIDISIKEFDISLEEAIERDKNRERTIGENIIIKMHNRYLK